MVDAVDPELDALIAKMEDCLGAETGADEDCQYGGGAVLAWAKAISAIKEHHPYFIAKEQG